MNFFCLFLFKCLQWVVWLFILFSAFGNERKRHDRKWREGGARVAENKVCFCNSSGTCAENNIINQLNLNQNGKVQTD